VPQIEPKRAGAISAFDMINAFKKGKT
jgi:hypothetical protein